MRRQYASSVYSQKSTTSAKSGRSFLSLTTPIWPSVTTTTTNDITIENTNKQGVWQNLKSWIPTTNATNTKKKTKNDSDSITTTRSTSSISKLKQLFNKKKQSGLNSNSPRTSFDIATPTTTNGEEEEEDNSSSTTTTNSNDNIRKSNHGPIGILVNSTESSAEAIAERKRRRHQRREQILKLQKQNRSLQHHHFVVNSNNNIKELASPIESSSSDTLLTDSPTTTTTTRKMVGFNVAGDDCSEDDNDWGYYNPRIMFVEPSPVPRFRNVAPPPPPSPPYLNIIVRDEDDDAIHNETTIHHVIKSPTTDDDEPTIFTTQRDSLSITRGIIHPPTMEQPLYDEEEMLLLMDSLKPKPLPRLYFNQPLFRGQVLKFSLQNAVPDDHIILFKFLTSNNNNHNNTQQQQQERYFVRPSAGKMSSTDQKEIVLFLNQVPQEMVKKDKIMIRWAVIQKNSQIEQWVNSLHESTRKKWIDMLDEEWPDQVTIRMTRLKIRFV